MTPMTPDVPAICADDVARLRKRLAEASPQPWVYRPDKYDDWGFIRGVERDDKGIGPFRPIVALARDSMVGTEQENDHRSAGTDPYGPNALLIVEAVNALPALLDTIERQRELLKRVRTSMVLLQQNSEGCAANHYGGDHQMFGMPGWLIDTRADLDALTASVAHLRKEQQP